MTPTTGSLPGSQDGSRDVARVARLADLIAGAVAGCPAVAALAGGPVATYLPGRTVAGVAIRDTDVQIAVIAAFGPPLAQVADQVRAVVAPLAPGLRIDVHIDDIQIDVQVRATESSSDPDADRRAGVS